MINVGLWTPAAMFASSFSDCPVSSLATATMNTSTYRVTLKSGKPFAMAGIQREPTTFATAEKNPVNFAILTTKANEAVNHIHDRMPIVLPLGREKEWLAPSPGAHVL